MAPKRKSEAQSEPKKPTKPKKPAPQPLPTPKKAPQPKKPTPISAEEPKNGSDEPRSDPAEPKTAPNDQNTVEMVEVYDEETGEWVVAPAQPQPVAPPTEAHPAPPTPKVQAQRPKAPYDFGQKDPNAPPPKVSPALGQRLDGTEAVYFPPDPVFAPGGVKEETFELTERSEMSREKDMAAIARLERRGWTVSEIAEKLKLDPRTVMADMKQVRKRFQLSIVHRKSHMVREKLAQLREVRKEAWEAWELSKEQFVKELTEEYVYSYGDGNTKNVERKQKQKERRLPGNEFLTTILKCLAQERELLGLDAPKKLDVQSMNLNWDVLLGDAQKAGVNLGNLPVVAVNGQAQLPYQPAGAIMPPIGPGLVVDLVEERIKELQSQNNALFDAAQAKGYV